MNTVQMLVPGTLKPDGTLELAETPALPAGPVEVLIRARPVIEPEAETWWEFLQSSRAALLAQGQTFRSKEAIDADRASQRSGDEARRQALQSLQRPRG